MTGSNPVSVAVEVLDLAYIAGLFDGEGCVFIGRPKATKNGRRYAKLTAKITQKDRMILDWVRDSFGFGGVYAKPGKSGAIHDFQVVYRDAEKFLTAILPYTHIKTAKIEMCLEEGYGVTKSVGLR